MFKNKITMAGIITNINELNSNLYTYINFKGADTNMYLTSFDGTKHRLKVKRYSVALNGTNDITINTGIPTSNIYDIRAMAYNSSSQTWFPLPNVGHSSAYSDHMSYNIAMYVSSGGVIHIKPYSSRSGYTALVTVYYI